MHVEKVKLAQAAAELIQDGDTVFIDAATTTNRMTAHSSGILCAASGR